MVLIYESILATHNKHKFTVIVTPVCEELRGHACKVYMHDHSINWQYLAWIEFQIQPELTICDEL